MEKIRRNLFLEKISFSKYMNNIKFINNIPYRGNLIKIMITEWCILGDCNQPECHHCFPVKNCKKHQLCINEGTCKIIPIPKKSDNI